MPYTPPKYPNEIPTETDLPDRQDDVDWIYAARYNEIKKELLACLNELGTLPKGSYASVRERLDALENRATNKIQNTDGDTSIETTDTDTIVGKVSGVECFRFHSNGIENLPKQSGCRVYRNSNQTISSGIDTKVQFNTEIYDIQNEFDSSTNYRFTANKDGRYLICFNINFTTNSTGRRGGLILKNGVSIGHFEATVNPNYFTTAQGKTIVFLNANDYIEIFAFQMSGSNLDIYGVEGHCCLVIQKIA